MVRCRPPVRSRHHPSAYKRPHPLIRRRPPPRLRRKPLVRRRPRPLVRQHVGPADRSRIAGATVLSAAIVTRVRKPTASPRRPAFVTRPIRAVVLPIVGGTLFDLTASGPSNNRP